MKRKLVLLTALLVASCAYAQQLWTVQTAAFRDYLQASQQVEELKNLGFDSYSEFVMEKGTQYARVRVGCFRSRDGAQMFARNLRGHVTAEAVAQPLSDGAQTRTCVRVETGFIKGGAWELQRKSADLLFRLELAGHTGWLQHDGSAWRFLRQAPVEAEGTAQQPPTIFDAVEIGGMQFVRATPPGEEPIIVCSGGQIIWQRDAVAVVERPNTVVACKLEGGAGGFAN